jgi:hypothetical protein
MLALQMGGAEFVLEGQANDATQYIDMTTHTVSDKPQIVPVPSKITLVADGIDSIIITGLPVPCTVIFDGTRYDVPDGVFEFTVNLPGDYSIKVEALNMLSYETAVIAS